MGVRGLNSRIINDGSRSNLKQINGSHTMEEQSRQATWKHQSIVSNGITLHSVTQGQGPLMLLLHGFPEFWYSWRHQIPEFAKDHRVVALDLRGYNDSEKPEGVSNYRLELLIQDVVGVIHSLGYDHCILVGHDWGGAIAWSIAETHPTVVDKLIVLNIPHPAKFAQGLRSPRQLLRSWYLFLFQIPRVPEWILSKNHYEPIGKMFSDMAINPSAFSPEDIAAYQEAAAKPGALTAMLNYYRNIFQPHNLISRNWSILSMPTLMIWGENDTALGKELTDNTEDFVEDLSIRYIPHCSHWVQQEQPQQVNQYMREFLEHPSHP